MAKRPLIDHFHNEDNCERKATRIRHDQYDEIDNNLIEHDLQIPENMFFKTFLGMIKEKLLC